MALMKRAQTYAITSEAGTVFIDSISFRTSSEIVSSKPDMQDVMRSWRNRGRALRLPYVRFHCSLVKASAPIGKETTKHRVLMIMVAKRANAVSV